MYNSQLPTDGKSMPQGASLGQDMAVFGKSTERHGNERIRQLLKHFGLRTSLIRLKVIDALLAAAESGHPVGVRGIHTHLLELDIPLSFLSVREVLKRLCSEGVIVLNTDKSYSLHPEAIGTLQRFD